MTVATGYQSERIDHVGIVAGVCREIGLAAYLDALDEHVHERVGVGTATVAMVLNGLGCSTRRLYLVPQFFANTPVAHLLGAGLTAEGLDRLTVQTAAGPQVLMLHLTPVHEQVLTLLGPAYREM